MYADMSEKLKPIGVLMIEHRLIERALDALELKLRTADAKPDVISLHQLIDFFASYADATHHGKEEDILFLEADKMSLSAELQQLLGELRSEHIQFRDYRMAMDEANRAIAAGSGRGLGQLRSIATEFVPKLRSHISKEDKTFFVGFDRLQGDSDRREMKERFKSFDTERIHQAYTAVIDGTK